ncbi:MAG: LLM class F420-dependent oxidoreductase, partial [SAR202 cluster bacterium]|nr:LLM class F420-dependent oxidoreductase [SAR202 cluster bacterium]
MEFAFHNPLFIPKTGKDADIFPELRERARYVDQHGYKYFLLNDHLWQIGVIGPPEEPFLEAYITLAAVAEATKRIGIGTLVTCTSYRNPALLAKMIATLDVVSGGRALLGIGAGWFVEEYKGYGYPFPSDGVRLQQLREAVQLAKRMWTEDEATYEGKHFSVRDAILAPKPLQKPHPRVLIGGQGPKVTMRIAAEEADAVNATGHPDGFKAMFAALKRHCEDIGRDYREIETTKTENVTLAPTRERAEAKWRSFGSPMRGNWKTLVGTPKDGIEMVKMYEQIGVTTLIVNFHGNDRESLELFTERVMPA